MSRSPDAPRKFRKLQSSAKAKEHRIYSLRDVKALYGVCDNTVSNWVKNGLAFILDGNRHLFRGDALNKYHRERYEKSRRPCTGAELFCVRCKVPRVPKGLEAGVRRPVSHRTVLEWVCGECGGKSASAVTQNTLERLISADLRVNPSNESGDS